MEEDRSVQRGLLADDALPESTDEISLALKDFYRNVTEKQVEKLAALCDMKGLRRVFADPELMRTAECFIENSLNISAAARAIYMHRNTMMYRLDKIRRYTGLDIRSFNSAVAFRVLYSAYRHSHPAK